jgi:hypothetical protein
MGVSAERWCSCGTKRRCVRQVQPGSVVVSHVVAVSWDERHLVAAEVALVFYLDLAAGRGPLVVVARCRIALGCCPSGWRP